MSELGKAMWAPVRHAMPSDPHLLPTCMCGILKRAVEDAMAVEQMPGYKLSMGDWHAPNGVCKVCLAGAVMVRTLKVDRDFFFEPTDFDTKTESILYAVNSMRVGGMESAFSRIYFGVKITTDQGMALSRTGQMIRNDNERPGARGRARWSTYLEAVDILGAVGL